MMANVRRFAISLAMLTIERRRIAKEREGTSGGLATNNTSALWSEVQPQPCPNRNGALGFSTRPP